MKEHIMAQNIDYLKIKDIKIPLILEQSSNIPIIQLDIIFKNSGSLQDEISGTANFVSRILNEGTKEKPFGKFYEKLEQNAINLHISNNKEIFTFSISCLKEDFAYAMKLLKELLKHPNISKKSISKVALLTKSSILEQQDNFDAIAKNQLNKMIFKNTPLQNPSIGSQESIKKINKKVIKTFIKKYIVLNNAILVLGGDFNKDDIKIIKKSINHLKIQKSSNIKKITIQEKPSQKRILKDTQQAYIYFASPYNIDIQDDDMYKAKVALFILGSSGFGSRLMEEIRVKQALAYSVYAYLNVSKHTSILEGYMQTKLQSEKKAIDIIKNELAKFVKKGALAKELNSAKKFILGSEPLRNETMTQRLDFRFNEYYKNLGENSQKKFLENVKNLTLKELNDFIKKHTEILDLSFSIVAKK
jgi:predicted Zn-dependent peptidase